MMLRDAMLSQGNWLFRWRSYLPLILLPTVIPVVVESGYVDRFIWPQLRDSWEIFALLVSYVGLCVRATAIGFAAPGTSGRNTHNQLADSLNTTGIYSIVRNPLYLGNFLIIIGLAMLPMVWWFMLLVTLAFFIYYERIIYAEEAFLEEKFGEEYRLWAARTPVFIPNPRLWRPSALGFSVRKVLRHEYTGLYVIVVFSTLLDFLCDVVGERESLAQWLSEDRGWIAYFVLGTGLYLLLRFLKRHTSLLNVPARAASA